MDLGMRRLLVAEKRQRGEVTRHQSKVLLERCKQAKIQELKQEEHERREQLIFVRREIRD